MISLEFANKTSVTLDGVTFGGGFGIQKYLEFFAGVTYTNGKELSLGFRREAARVIGEAQQGSNATLRGEYARFLLNVDKDDLRYDELYDGLSLITPGGTTPFYKGDVITNSTNHAFVFGVAIPLDFKALLGSKK